jgi:7-cyano-7-deazaguanine synthase
MSRQVAILLSGGVDSYVAYLMAKSKGLDFALIFVDYNQPYRDKELIAIDKLIKPEDHDRLIMVRADLVSDKLDNVPTVQKQEVYGRNLLLAFYGAQVASRVWLSALATEINPTAVRDKHPEFRQMCSALLTFIFKSKRLVTEVEFPLEDYTKTQAIALGLQLGATPDDFRNTVSCYDGVEQNCGICSTCAKRYIAFSNNGIDEKYRSDPLLNNAYLRTIEKQAIAEAMEPKSYEERKLGRFSHARLEEMAIMSPALYEIVFSQPYQEALNRE